jgi:hypothetical protein
MVGWWWLAIILLAVVRESSASCDHVSLGMPLLPLHLTLTRPQVIHYCELLLLMKSWATAREMAEVKGGREGGRVAA